MRYGYACIAEHYRIHLYFLFEKDAPMSREVSSLLYPGAGSLALPSGELFSDGGPQKVPTENGGEGAQVIQVTGASHHRDPRGAPPLPPMSRADLPGLRASN